MSSFTKIFMMIIWSTVFVPSLYAAQVQEVTILADDSYPPYSFVDKGQIKGIYIDIVKEAAKLLKPHYKVKIVAYPWKRALHEIENGTVLAILPPYKRLKERSYIWPYSVPIMEEVVVAFCQEDIDLTEYLKPQTIEKGEPLAIGINAGYLILNEKLEQAKKKNNIIIRENKSTFANLMKLYYKRFDCYLHDRYSALREFSHIAKERNINFDNIKEALIVMSQTAHIGYTNNPTHSFLYKDDFVFRMDKALSLVLSSNKYQEVINSYVTIE